MWSCFMYVGCGGALTNGCLTKLLISHLVGNVGPHQHIHRDAKSLPNHFRDELQPVGALVYTLGTGWSSGQALFMPTEGFPPRNPTLSKSAVHQCPPTPQMSCCHPNPAKVCCKEGGWHMKIHLKTLFHIPSNQPTSPRQCIASTFLYNSLPSSPNQLLFHIPQTSLLLIPPGILWTPPKLPGHLPPNRSLVYSSTNLPFPVAPSISLFLKPPQSHSFPLPRKLLAYFCHILFSPLYPPRAPQVSCTPIHMVSLAP